MSERGKFLILRKPFNHLPHAVFLGDSEMPEINRTSIKDAQKIAEEFMPDETVRQKLLIFLSNAIVYSNGLNPDNWNLNLDKNGGFIRFNVGHEYCIEIFKKYSSILVLRDVLKDNIGSNKFRIEFKGYSGKNRVFSDDLLSVPDCLVKVPGSVACHITHENITDTLPYLEEPNRCFISYAISNTVQLPSMNEAHSPGFIAYLSELVSTKIPNPVYILSENNFYNKQEKEEKKARRLSTSELLDKIKNNNHCIPERAQVTSSKFIRNPYVSEYAKRIASGICQDCHQPAPFINKVTNEPFLETHHITPLAKGGADTIENTIAICPNCHKRRHYG